LVPTRLVGTDPRRKSEGSHCATPLPELLDPPKQNSEMVTNPLLAVSTPPAALKVKIKIKITTPRSSPKPRPLKENGIPDPPSGPSGGRGGTRKKQKVVSNTAGLRHWLTLTTSRPWSSTLGSSGSPNMPMPLSSLMGCKRANFKSAAQSHWDPFVGLTRNSRCHNDNPSCI
jgi:hypothetical protein